MNGNQSADVCLCTNLPMECIYWTCNRVSLLPDECYYGVRAIKNSNIHRFISRLLDKHVRLRVKTSKTLQTSANHSFREVIRRPPIARWSFSVLKANAERLKSENIIIQSINQSYFILKACSIQQSDPTFLCGKTYIFKTSVHWVISALLDFPSLLAVACHLKQKKNIICL